MTDDLVNKGFILNHPSEEPGRTFIVTGLHRSGTSVIASILYQAGLFIGSEFNSAIYEDEEDHPGPRCQTHRCSPEHH